MGKLNLPESGMDKTTPCEIESDNSIVVVGPNGSGKTRLGAWIEFESEQKDKVHRISAQKSLSIPDTIRPKSVKEAEMELKVGFYEENMSERNYFRRKESQRWSRDPATSLLNDYGKLLVYLFSEDYEEARDHKVTEKETDEHKEPPETKIDKVQKIWESLIPHRGLKILGSSIETYVKDDRDGVYDAKEMSDGERVIFYLIGECLAAPENGIIVIDEPELHLHKSIQRELWDRIENERSDCTFVYLTHDLDFASTRTGAAKVCLNDYDGDTFYWYQVEENESIPEDVYLEILGSRDPILFVEGKQGSYDEQLYNLVYPDFTVKSIGGCTKVIEATKSFRSISSMHHLDCYGIIDRDYRSEEEINALKERGIYCSDVAEVENLFLIDEVLLAVAKQFCEPSPEEIVEDVHKWIFEEFDNFKRKYAAEATSAYLNYVLNGSDYQEQDINDLKSNFNILTESIDLGSYYSDKIDYATKLIEEEKYDGILTVFNHKGLVKQVGRFFKIKPAFYTKKVKDIVDSGNEEIINAFENYLPEL